jgi:hypothetical protein
MAPATQIAAIGSAANQNARLSDFTAGTGRSWVSSFMQISTAADAQPTS